MTRGMVLGKFLPPHLGHLYLVEFAQRFVDELVVVVGTLDAEPIAGTLRYEWMTELCPNARVVHLTDENPQQPSEHPEFWDIWRESLLRVLPGALDFVFASEHYGARLAAELSAEYIPVDVERSVVPVSGTAVRANPLESWEFLPAPVRAHYAKRVCVFGPESTGKSTLARRLAEHYDTLAVPEYARTYLEALGRDPIADDMPRIAAGQIASEHALARRCNRVLICDTDPLATAIWSDVLFGARKPEVEAAADAQRYDVYLLCDADVPWVADSVRYLPSERQSFLDRCERELSARDRPYVTVSGDWNRRFDIARRSIDSLLSS